MARGNVVFDVVGTLVGYERLFNAIDVRLGERLRAQGVKPSLLGQMWIESAEREYTYLSMSGRYVPFSKVVHAIFFRMLFKAGILHPRTFATDEDLAYVMSEGYQQLEMRPGAKEYIQKLRDAGMTVWALTAADRDGCAAYFRQAGIHFPNDNLVSCDTSSIGKPTPEAYRPLFERLSSNGQPQPWFAAAHMWDCMGAKQAGFQAAFCSVFELEPSSEIFGEVDVMWDTLPGMASAIAASA